MSDIDTVNDEISLLDIAVVIAENWLMLVIVPLLLGIGAYLAMALTTPREYQSEALLRISATDAALLRSAQVLNPAIVGSSYIEGYAGSLSRARQQLVDNLLTITPEPETSLYRVGITAGTAEEANDLLERIISSLISNSAPTDTRRALLNIQLEEARTAIAELDAALTRLNRASEGLASGSATTNATVGDFGQSVVTIVSDIEERHSRVFQLEQALQGSVSEEDVIQPPTMPDSADPRGLGMRTVLVVLGSGFVLLIVAFIRSGFRQASKNPEQIEKVNRIRRAFWLKPISSSTREAGSA